MTKQMALDNTVISPRATTTQDIVINAVLFQVCWFTAVLAGGFWALLPLALMLMHFVRVIRFENLLTIVTLAGLGIAIDSFYLHMNVYQFAPAAELPLLNLPVWLACLWVGFCLSLPLSLAWLVRKPYYFVPACAIFGPLSYLAGRQWQAVDFSDHHVLLLVLEWAIFSIISVVFLQARLNGTYQQLPELLRRGK